MRKIIFFITIAILVTSIPINAIQAASLLEVNAIGTIAGYSSLIKVQSLPNQELEILIKKPDGASLIIPVATDANGHVQFDLYPYHTKQAGLYQIAGTLKEDQTFTNHKTFPVFPDEVSENRSEIIADTLIGQANGINPINLTIRLKDQYGNPIANHTLTVISSRAIDTIQAIDDRQTNYQGESQYQITSTEPGVSIYSIFDTTALKSLEKRIKVVYHSAFDLKGIGGQANILIAAAGDPVATPGPVAFLKIANIPESASVSEALTFKVVAYDKNNILVTNYNGRVHFSTTDPNAVIPTDYTFTAQDLGQHTFSLALSFATVGTQTFTVNDSQNIEIKGSASVTVNTDNPNANNHNQNAGTEVMIVKPSEGKYTTPTITLEGTAPAGNDLKISDNNKEIGKSKADSTGQFNFVAKNLSDGQHLIQVAALDKEGKIMAKSKAITIQIDSSAPDLDAVELNPTGSVQSGTKVQLKVYSEPGLAQIAAIFNDEIKELSPDLNNPGLYTTVLEAPQQPGQYPIDIIVVDELGNDVSYREKATITVQGEANNEDNDSPFPAVVTGLKAEPGPSRVTLSWQASRDDIGIDHYRVYYGTNPFELLQKVDTFTNQSTWYVPNLKAGTKYYFALTAIDTDDNQSKTRSDVVNATPLAGDQDIPTTTTESPNAASDQLSSDHEIENATDISADPDNEDEPISTATSENNPTSGPEIIWIVIGTIIFTDIYLRMRKYLMTKFSTQVKIMINDQTISND